MASSSSSLKLVKVNLLGKRKWGDGLGKHKEMKATKVLVEKSNQANLISAKEAVVTGKTLFVHNLSYQSPISEIIDFFKNVVPPVRLRLIVRRRGIHKSYGFLVYASAKEAMEALEKKNGEYFCGRNITLVRAQKIPSPRSHVNWSKVQSVYLIQDYFTRASFLMEEDEAVGGLEGILFVANLSPQTKILHIKEFFNSVGQVVTVRLVVNHECKHVGYGFIEFASPSKANKALEKNGKYLHDHQIFLYAPKKAQYPPRPKYNLAERLCYEEYLRRQKLVIEEDETVEETPDFLDAVAVREKSLFVSHISSEAEISDIIGFFKDVGQVVHVRLIVDDTGEHVGDGFVEFASANEAEKALKEKNGENLLDHEIFLVVAKKALYPPQPKYCIDRPGPEVKPKKQRR